MALFLLVSAPVSYLTADYSKQHNRCQPSVAPDEDCLPSQSAASHAREKHSEKGERGVGWIEQLFEKATDTLLVAFNGLLVVFTGLLFYATVGLRSETKRLSDAADLQKLDTAKSLAISRDAADAAKKSATVAEAALTIAERPYLIPTEPRLKMFRFGPPGMPPSEPPEWGTMLDYGFLNMGRTVGFIKEVTVELIFVDSLPDKPSFVEPKALLGHYPIGPEKPYKCLTYVFKTRIDAATFSQIKSNISKAFFFGYVRYSDVFDNLHTEGFCFRFLTIGIDQAVSECAVVAGRNYNYSRTEKIPAEGFEILSPQGAELSAEDIEKFMARSRDDS